MGDRGEYASPKTSRHRGRLVALVVAAAVAIPACTSTLTSLRVEPTPPTPPKVTFDQSTQVPPPSSLAEMVKRVLPSVVNVRVTGLGSDPFGGGAEVQAEGSGVVIDAGGIVLTNNHVIEGAVEVEVVFTDGRSSLQGTVIGADVEHDVAVVKVEATDLTPIPIGKSSALELGDSVTAIGFPLDLGGPTVTDGIVSGLNRTIDVQKGNGETEHLVGLLQTDAAINPGNSGGPLVDSLGQLVGINTAGVQAGSAENVGFAIAIDDALPIVQDIISRPPSDRPWLGVTVVTVDTPAGAAQLGIPADTRGAGIASILSGGPADEAGIREEEVIVSLDGRTVGSAEDLGKILADLSPGDRVEVELVSSEGTRTVQIELGNRPGGV